MFLLRMLSNKQIQFKLMPVTKAEPAGKASLVYSRMQTRLLGQYKGKCPTILVYVSKPLTTVLEKWFCLLRIIRK